MAADLTPIGTERLATVIGAERNARGAAQGPVRCAPPDWRFVMATYRDQGIVLRTYKLGETDRIVHLLSQGRGKVRAVAKGIRRPGSRFGGRLEVFSHVDVQMYEGRNLDMINQADLLAPHAHVRDDFARSAAGSVMVEFVDAVAQEDERDTALFLLLRAGLQALDAQPADPSVFVDAFLLRAASTVGFRVYTDACAACRAPGPHAFLSVKAGGTLCPDCAPAGTRAVEMRVIEIVAMFASHRQWAALPALGLEGDARRTAAAYIRAFVEHHLDRRLRSYEAVPRDVASPERK